MKITFLGSGSAFVSGKENYHSNILIETERSNILYDAGTTIKDAMDDAGYKPDDIDNIFISHLHGDHSYGLEFLGFNRYFYQFPFGVNKSNLYAPKPLRDDLWNKQLCASMDSLDEPATLDTYFNVIDNCDKIKIDNIVIHPFNTIHSRMESYGIYIDNPGGKSVMISGDTKFTPNHLRSEYRSADIIFQDSEFKEYPGGVHAQFHELKTLPSEIKEKMYLYHYMLDGKTFEELENEVLEAGFKGLVPRGFTLEV